MSIDFDSAALQTQHDEEEYDQEDYAREQELHKLLTDLPDDMLEDSQDSSSPELEYSTCSNKNPGNSPQWNHQWSDRQKPISNDQNFPAEYSQAPGPYPYRDEGAPLGGINSHPHTKTLPPTWNHQSQGQRFIHTSADKSILSNDFSTDETYESHTYPVVSSNQGVFNRDEGRGEDCGDQIQQMNAGDGDRGSDQYKASYNSRHPAHQAFNSQEQQLDHLQREFLDSTQKTAEKEQLAQLKILNQAQQRQIKDMEQKMEDSMRSHRYLEHQYTMIKDDRDGLAASLKESSRLVQEYKERELKMQKILKTMEQQIQTLDERDQEHVEKQRVAEAAVDSLKQQMLEMCRSDTLSRSREQHNRDMEVLKEQHEMALLNLEQKLDSTSHALKEQSEIAQRLREQVKHTERQREEDQLDRAKVVNTLSQRLEESQQQCAKLLQTSSVQDMSQLQIKLQQALSAKVLSDNMNRVLQEDLADLKEQITMYESAVKHGVLSFETNDDWENQLSESCSDLGLKKTNWKNTNLHSTALANLQDSKLPKDDAIRLLRGEMQRCLAHLKGKRVRLSQLQEDLQRSQAQAAELQTKLEEAKLCSSVSTCVRETSQTEQHQLSGQSQNELLKLQEDKRNLQEQVELLKKKIIELKQSEDKVRGANAELCTKMREMIQELDQEKQEAAQRSERIHQQFRDDVVNKVKSELMQEHDSQMQMLRAQHDQAIQQMQTQLSDANDKMSAVQECYISVCKEKDMLEESLRNQEEEGRMMKETEKLREGRRASFDKLKTELEAQHQATLLELKSLWTREKETEIQKQVDSHVDSAEARWNEERLQLERTWSQRLEEASRDKHSPLTMDGSSQTDEVKGNSVTITVEELESKLLAQKLRLQQEADKVKCKAVNEARKQVEREVHEKNLEEMAKQVEGAVTRAYNRWIEDLTSLPEYQSCLEAERDKWEELSTIQTAQKVSLAVREAEERWRQRRSINPKEQSSESQVVVDLQEEIAKLQDQLEKMRKEQEALLKAELAGARAAWNQNKQQEISNIRLRCEQVYQSRLQEQQKKLQEALQKATEEAKLQQKELLLQLETKFRQTTLVREEEWKCQQVKKEQDLRQQIEEEFLRKLRSALVEVQMHIVREPNDEVPDESRTSISGGSICDIVHVSCKKLVDRAVSQAKKEWKRINEERLSHVLKETQQQHEREINQIESSVVQREQARCRKECVETAKKLHRKNQELQKHLAKACRQLQQTVRDHKTTVQKLKDEHESSLEKLRDEHLQQLEEAKRQQETSGASELQRLQQSLEEKKQQYLRTVEKIRGDMARYLQESRERAEEMLQKERHDAARQMRHYYLSCVQELLEDGGKATGAEKKIMNAASKLAAMAKILETPLKSKSGKNCCLTIPDFPDDGNIGLPKSISTQLGLLDTRAQVVQDKQNPLKQQQSSTSESGISAETGSKSQASSYTQLLKTSPSVALKSKSRSRLTYRSGGQAFLTQELPVRDNKHTDWSASSSDSDPNIRLPRPPLYGRNVDPVRPFSLSTASAADFREMGDLTSNSSDLTVYKDFMEKMAQTQTHPKAMGSLHREPTPGSEAERQQAVDSRPQFSELRRCQQQDSGFDSPVYHKK
ncbi:centrosomal protein of 152 kDa isoform X3 [Synchiropus splendidus]|uniref:centrosomal protein of 152 kDa isoform X3 n=1 Tax=Synchiropus splendidus TaxID=270530 RepID=UPI00237E4DEA|nr:centrosomal protein of 152 kDa isoform X3 [Synchiropus splendidus]